tara:strand:- start:166 stop:465 length:300 start_codon:yes stop_codon:yes gene_type:complete
MTINIHYIKMPPSAALNEFVDKKLQKLAKKYEWLIRADVRFKMENNVYRKGNICEIELSLPGPKIFAHSTSETFEAAAKETTSDLANQLKKRRSNFTTY